MDNLINTFKEALPILSIIFIVVFIVIILTRIILTLLIHFTIKKYAHLKKKNPFKKKDPVKYEKEEDEILRQIPKAHSAVRANNIAKARQAQNNGNYELVASNEQKKEQEELNEVKIVDMVKPVGFWTSVILGQKLTYLINSAQIINKRGKQGFWVSMIEAQEQAAGRQHSRGR